MQPSLAAKKKKVCMVSMALCQTGKGETQTVQDSSMLGLGFTEVVREIPDWGIHSSASQGRGSRAFQDTAEGSDGALCLHPAMMCVGS